MKRFLIITFFFVVKCALANAQQATNVIGSIKDTGNLKQVDGAIISLINTKDSSSFSFVRTDTSGNFFFTKVPEGKYRLSQPIRAFMLTGARLLFWQENLQ